LLFANPALQKKYIPEIIWKKRIFFVSLYCQTEKPQRKGKRGSAVSTNACKVYAFILQAFIYAVGDFVLMTLC